MFRIEIFIIYYKLYTPCTINELKLIRFRNYSYYGNPKGYEIYYYKHGKESIFFDVSCFILQNFVMLNHIASYVYNRWGHDAIYITNKISRRCGNRFWSDKYRIEVDLKK